jgi:5'-nucleotidase (lipoprotein e(P4) family)
VALLASGCAGTTAVQQPVAGGKLPHHLRWVAESAEYRAAIWQAFALAGERLEELAVGRTPGTWAVSLDADETVMSNLAYSVQQAAVGRSYDRESWRRWVEQEAAAPLPGANEFLHRVQEMGGRVVIVTNRWDDERAATEANLRALDVPFDLLLARTEDRQKEPRWAAVEAGTAGLPPAEIVLWVGDNIEDFPELDQSIRTRPTGELAPFGDRFIVLPNPMYGSWE